MDTNVFIALEPFAGALEAATEPAARLVRLVSEQQHRLFVHPASADDLREGADLSRLAQRLAELQKYPELQEGTIPKSLSERLPAVAVGSNDHRDLRLLAALYNKAVVYLITEDGRLRRRAARAGLGDRVLSISDAVSMLEQLAPAISTPPPKVSRVASYALDGEQEIFESLREDYPGFDDWLNEKVRPDNDNRDCYVVFDDGKYAALAIVKRREASSSYDFPVPITKIATLKVDADYSGSKYGELLLKAIFQDWAGRDGSLYVEVYSKHQALVALLNSFGFIQSAVKEGDELVLMKRRRPSPEEQWTDALGYNIMFGPPAILGAGHVFVVPIIPKWHTQLFPDAPNAEEERGEQLLLPLSDPAVLTHPWGNALRKAYICNSSTRRILPGDTLLFYQSGPDKSITAVGVVEETLRSADSVEVASFVGRRTVYTPSEIAQMCSRVGGALAILFRQDRFIEPSWGLEELQQQEVLTSWPQSITQVRERGATWVHQQLAARP
ncbi:GNAT superfamily N-acetyltransferase [Geodermatophilus bullaregiensis]|uniref:GNAT family N-acetyltransferase n=1 Tax=Geodermatophilus bullaregiensis TaxID=1564160 RepID=UPI001959B40D|nr:GNAT family N-acetyltransferase [Geodermatophilus bullaregiensis]MBM7806773.1 GNAT superfamily N-acetyltransferase [Geodermatophilus bullaregiensis]